MIVHLIRGPHRFIFICGLHTSFLKILLFTSRHVYWGFLILASADPRKFPVTPIALPSIVHAAPFFIWSKGGVFSVGSFPACVRSSTFAHCISSSRVSVIMSYFPIRSHNCPCVSFAISRCASSEYSRPSCINWSLSSPGDCCVSSAWNFCISFPCVLIVLFKACSYR